MVKGGGDGKLGGKKLKLGVREKKVKKGERKKKVKMYLFGYKLKKFPPTVLSGEKMNLKKEGGGRK